MFLKWVANIQDAVFPYRCLHCDEEGEILCLFCAASARFVCVERCPYCKRQTPYGACCARHAGRALDGLVAMTPYADKTVQALVKAWKFDYIRAVEREISKRVNQFVGRQTAVLPQGDWTVVSVPLHERRVRERGFDQALVFAQIVAASLSLKIQARVLRRTRYRARHQADIDDKARRRHAISTHDFSVRKNASLPSHVVLVDDVYTTGATMISAAQVLKQHGVERVWGIVFARS